MGGNLQVGLPIKIGIFSSLWDLKIFSQSVTKDWTNSNLYVILANASRQLLNTLMLGSFELEYGLRHVSKGKSLQTGFKYASDFSYNPDS